MNKSLYYKLMSEVIFTLGYLTVLLASNTANTFPIKLSIIVFTISIVSYILCKKTRNKTHRVLIYALLAFFGFILILISKYLSITPAVSIAIIVIGSILCTPFILSIENIA